MNPSVTGATVPASASQCTAAPTRRRITRPFAAVPHDVAADPRLTPTDVRTIAALLYYACSKPTCYPSDAGIADRVHRHPGTVRRCLKRLEDLGYIRREFVPATPANPTGRLIHLRFTAPDWPRPCGTPERQRTPSPERRCAPTPCADAQDPRAPAPEVPRALLRAEEDVIVEKMENLEEVAKITPPLRSRPAVMPPSPAAPPLALRATEPVQAMAAASGAPRQFDLRAIGAIPDLQPRPATPYSPPQRRPLGLGLTLEELARVADDTADPILAAELARRTAPPTPAEPPPAMLPTVALLEGLPGRHDLIMAMARRLCEETGDFNTATQRTFEKMAEAVATRAVPAAVLLSCWRQAMGPKAEHRGKVLVAAWKRSVAEVPLHC